MTESHDGLPSSGRSLRHRVGGVVAVVTAYVPPELARAARVRVAESGSTISALIAGLLREHLDGERSE